MDLHPYIAPAIFSLLSIAIFFSAVQAVCVSIDDSIPSTPVAEPPFIIHISPAPLQSNYDYSTLPLNDLVGSIGDEVHSTGDYDAQLMQMCNATDYIELCLTSLGPMLKGKDDADSMIRMAVKAATDYTKLALLAAERFAADPSISSGLAMVISDSIDSYHDALDNFSEALESLPEKDTGTMNSMLSAAITDFSDIDDFLAGYNNTPLPEFNKKLVELTSNSLAIVSYCYPNTY